MENVHTVQLNTLGLVKEIHLNEDEPIVDRTSPFCGLAEQYWIKAAYNNKIELKRLYVRGLNLTIDIPFKDEGNPGGLVELCNQDNNIVFAVEDGQNGETEIVRPFLLPPALLSSVNIPRIDLGANLVSIIASVFQVSDTQSQSLINKYNSYIAGNEPIYTSKSFESLVEPVWITKYLLSDIHNNTGLDAQEKHFYAEKLLEEFSEKFMIHPEIFYDFARYTEETGDIILADRLKRLLNQFKTHNPNYDFEDRILVQLQCSFISSGNLHKVYNEVIALLNSNNRLGLLSNYNYSLKTKRLGSPYTQEEEDLHAIVNVRLDEILKPGKFSTKNITKFEANPPKKNKSTFLKMFSRFIGKD